MTKLIIQIPCYNESESLQHTLAALPRALAGVDQVEWLVIDDGSTDGTAEIARQCGVDHIISLPRNQGLAKAFMVGLHKAVEAGADIIVNTDADNQYYAADLPKLIGPILKGQADIVVGARPIRDIAQFSWLKKRLQQLGSWAVRMASNTDIPDAPSGFRAMTRSAALRLNVFNSYTYTVEMIIQAGRQGMVITSVPVRTNEVLRPSRLMKSTFSYVLRSLMVIGRIFMLYQPLRFFALLGGVLFSAGVLLGVRWLILYYMGDPGTHVPSLVLAAVLMLMGFQLAVLGLVADLLAANRRMLEEVQLRLRRAEFGMGRDQRP
jgi:glycosyltransferase involved in cell wall biosynthesis